MTMERRHFWAAIMGAVTIAMPFAVSTPAIADDYRYRDDRYHRELHRDIENDRRDIRQDVEQIRRDEARLCDLERERDRYRRCKDWRAAKDVEREISYLKRQLDAERRDVKRDIADVRKDQKRERDYHRRDRGRDRNYDRDRDRYWDR